MTCPAPPPSVAGKNLRIVHADAHGVIASRGSSLYQRAAGSSQWTLHLRGALLDPVRLVEASRLWRRLFRSDVVSACAATDEATVCVGRKQILRAAPGTRVLHRVFRVVRGTRPLSIAATRTSLFWGEYFDNPKRDAVTIFGSRDGGATWFPAHTFSAGSIRHVHRVIYDGGRNRVWVLTGDSDQESKILWTDDEFASLNVATEGSQRSRAVAAVPVPGGLVFGTDDPQGRNWIRLLQDDGTIVDLAELEGPSFYAARAGEFVLVSTAVEPSTVNLSGAATLMIARASDLRDWRLLLSLRKDSLPMKLFQYGNIVLPEGPGDGTSAWASGVSLEGGDGVVWRWSLATLREFFAARPRADVA